MDPQQASTILTDAFQLKMELLRRARSRFDDETVNCSSPDSEFGHLMGLLLSMEQLLGKPVMVAVRAAIDEIMMASANRKSEIEFLVSHLEIAEAFREFAEAEFGDAKDLHRVEMQDLEARIDQLLADRQELAALLGAAGDAKVTRKSLWDRIASYNAKRVRAGGKTIGQMAIPDETQV